MGDDPFGDAFARAAVGLAVVDAHGRIELANSTLAALAGCEPNQLPGLGLGDVVQPDDLATLTARLDDADETGRRTMPVVVRALNTPPGEVRKLRVVVDPVVGARGRVARLVLTFQEVTESLSSPQLFETMIERSEDIYSILSPDMEVLYASKGSIDGHGDDETPLPLELVHRDDRRRVLRAFASALGNPDHAIRLRYRVIAPTGVQYVETSFTNLTGDPGVAGVMLHTRDVTDEVAAQNVLRRLAYHDDLTGLPNRTLLIERLTDQLQRPLEHGGVLAVEMLKLDRFELINDAYGHEVGDELLTVIATRIIEVADEGATVARLGGAEFVIVKLVDSPQRASALAAALCTEVSIPVQLSTGDEVIVTASIGIAVSSGQPAEALLREAEAALHRAKARSSDSWQVYDEELRRQATTRHHIEQGLRRALTTPGIALGYQPIVELRSDRVVGAEALLRLRLSEPEATVIDIIDVAEETGLIVELGERILDTACSQASLWRDSLFRDESCLIAVNVSARQLDTVDFASSVRSALARAALAPHQLCLEITETTLLEADRRVVEALFALKDLGVRLALDDFGTGYSSLTYLKKFPIDAVKIDRSFVSGLETNANDAEIVRAVVGLGQALGLTIVAEGIENEHQEAILRALGCDEAQGYFYSAALSDLAFVKFAAARQSDRR
jgi:diguanylate cyclase (GGDEF)-like protein/PAS domain S-box-containing protein